MRRTTPIRPSRQEPDFAPGASVHLFHSPRSYSASAGSSDDNDATNDTTRSFILVSHAMRSEPAEQYVCSCLSQYMSLEHQRLEQNHRRTSMRYGCYNIPKKLLSEQHHYQLCEDGLHDPPLVVIPSHRTSSSSSNRTRLFRRISAIRRSSLSTFSLLSCNRGCMQIISRECACKRSHKSQPGPWRHRPTSVGAIAAVWVHLTSASSSQ